MIFVDMDTADWVFHAIIGVMGLSSVVMMAVFGASHMSERYLRIESAVDRVLNQQLLMEVPARLAIGVGILLILGFGMVCAVVLGSPLWFLVGVVFGALLPGTVINVLEARRRRRLDEQIVDGITTLASGVRAGLNLVQSFQLLATNSIGPLQQEVRQMMREYELGTDLNQAMRNASTRIGSSYYRLLFAAIEAHRQRGGDMSESLDRISESLREIQRLEGRLDSLTAQGRAQARMIAVMPFVIIVIYWFIDQEGLEQVFIQPAGRLILLVALALIVAGFLWIRRIMQVDI